MKKFPLHLRKDYEGRPLQLKQMKPNPIQQYKSWFNTAVKAKVFEPNAAVLATVGKKSRPSARFVLIKGIEDSGFVFFTNYKSRKGSEITSSPFGALAIYWSEFSRQIRIEGRIEKIDAKESDKYFAIRPEGAQVAATISPQSMKIPSREWLVKRFEDELNKDSPRNRPLHWGGYRLVPIRMEFWQGQSSRLHHRVVYELKKGRWVKYLVAP